MDATYLEWLSSLPGWTPDKARRVAHRYPSFERLRAATREELASVEGLTPADADVLLDIIHGSAGRDADSHLFLCTACGSFVGVGAKACPSCGVEFDGVEEDELPKEFGAFLQEE